MYQMQGYPPPPVHDERLQVRSKPVPVQVPPRPRQTANPHRARRMLPHYPLCRVLLYCQRLHSLVTALIRGIGERDNDDKIIDCVLCVIVHRVFIPWSCYRTSPTSSHPRPMLGRLWMRSWLSHTSIV